MLADRSSSPTPSLPSAAPSSTLAVMNFLNEVALDHPLATSLASGRPAERFFDLARWLGELPRFVAYFAKQSGVDYGTAERRLAQYGRTAGVINDLVAAQVTADQGLGCTSDQIVLTAGCQEAIAICLQALCSEPGDVLVVRSPTYIGATGIAELYGIGVVGVSCADPDQFVDALADVVADVTRSGRRVRALYVIPTFDNPSGTSLSAAVRADLVGWCAERRIAVLEDSPYDLFRFDGAPVAPAAAVDEPGCVLFLGTYSKTLCPAVRVGFVRVPPRWFGSEDAARALVERLVALKSFLTVNTSQLMQAVVGGVLLANGGSLARANAPAVAHYRANRDRMLAALTDAFRSEPDARWNAPEGGFFLTLTLPIRFGRDEVEACAREQRVVVTPLSFFAIPPDDAHARTVRLAFSSVSADEIAPAVHRLAAFVESRL